MYDNNSSDSLTRALEASFGRVKKPRPYNPNSFFGITYKTTNTRLLLTVGAWVIKLPLFFPYQAFLQGLLANLQERRISKTKDLRLCPVIWADPLGLVLIMPRTKPLDMDGWNFYEWYEEFVNRDNPISVDCTQTAFGVLNGYIVAVDYGD